MNASISYTSTHKDTFPHRYISRTVLIPFVEDASQGDVILRMDADEQLQQAMESASQALPLAIGLESDLEMAANDLKTILKRLQDIFPSFTPQRIYISYGWLLLCTLMVWSSIYMFYSLTLFFCISY